MNNSAWVSAAQSDIGTVRKVNEDDYYDAPQANLWCIADGMGGHARGDVASHMITKELAELVSSAADSLSVERIVACIEQVNQSLVKLSETHKGIVGSTVVVLFFEDVKAHFIWAGDSRIYRLRDNNIKRITRDHSQVEDMVDAGLIKAEEAKNHPKANVITRAVGASDEIELEVKTFDLNSNDQYFLCSDGLNKVMSDTEIEYALLTMPTKTITQRLIEVALSRNARDNVTVTVVRNSKNSDDNNQLHETLPLDDTLPLNYKPS